MISYDYVICPFCGKQHSKNEAIGNTGLINHVGSTRSIWCYKCDNEFICTYSVKIKYKTTKER